MSFDANSFRPIPQPPHSAGLQYKGLRSKIDPQQVPSVVDVFYKDQARWERDAYMTASEQPVPSSCADYFAIDQGNSSPRFLRMTTYGIPSTSSLATTCHVPLGIVVQPFAQQLSEEEPIQVVDFGEAGPPRCVNCRGYINPWCTWEISGGGRWKCNLCGTYTEESFSELQRVDHTQRAELNRGTIDFIVPKEYWAVQPSPRLLPSYSDPLPKRMPSTLRAPRPLNYVFVIDVSYPSMHSGFLRSTCLSILEMLYGDGEQESTANQPGLPQARPPCIPPTSEIAIIAFDRLLYFYELSPHLTQAKMLVVPDIDDVFIPLHNAIYANLTSSRHIIERLLKSLPKTFEQTGAPEAALGSSLRAGLASLAGRGGQIIAFQSSMPSIGIGSLEERSSEEDSQLYGTEKEKSLFKPRDTGWIDLAEECADEGIGVNLFLAPSRFIDIGTIGVVASITGGEIFYHPRFEPVRDDEVFRSQLRRLISREMGYDCTMRLRCSKGLRTKSPIGNFYLRSSDDIQFGTLDADKSITFMIEHEHDLEERGNPRAFFQTAVLYTTVEGQRRVRVCNRMLPVVSLAGNVFRFGDIDTLTTVMAKQAVLKMQTQLLREIRDDISQKVVSILLAYRKSCAASTAPSQFVLPEDFKLLPVFSLAIIKAKAIKGGNVNPDVRNYHAHAMLSKGTAASIKYLYPRLLALHDLSEDTASPDSSGRMQLPWLMRNSHAYMESRGVYLIDNGELMVLWIGTDASTEVLEALYGRDSLYDLKPDELSKLTISVFNKFPLQRRESLLSKQLWNILDHRRKERGGRLTPILLARQNLDAAELEFSNMLVEDQNNGDLSYSDHLCHLHRQINNTLASRW